MDVIIALGLLGVILFGAAVAYKRKIYKEIEDESLEIAKKQVDEAEEIDFDVTRLSDAELDDEL